jgi:ADP-heptose:LPS heptosyltransferase
MDQPAGRVDDRQHKAENVRSWTMPTGAGAASGRVSGRVRPTFPGAGSRHPRTKIRHPFRTEDFAGSVRLAIDLTPLMLTLTHLADVVPQHDNLFLFWDGQPPSPDRMDQIRVCLRSIRRHAPHALVHLFSNVIEPEQIEIPEVRLVRWERDALVAGSPLAGQCPAPDGDWVHWSDLFRVVALWRWGGSYWDLDDILIRPPTALSNVIPACFLTHAKAAGWHPNPTVSGHLAHDLGRLPPETPFRLANDPLLNFAPRNRFLEAWLRAIPSSHMEGWGQSLPTAVFASAPSMWRDHLNPLPWCDLLYHPWEDGHHPDDQRYPGARLLSDKPVNRQIFLKSWATLVSCYPFPLVKNHEWKCQKQNRPARTCLEWAVQQAWAAHGMGNPAGDTPEPMATGRITAAGCPIATPVQKLILKCPLPLGDLVVLSAAIRDLHRSHPGEFVTDVRTVHPALWHNNPHITQIPDDDPLAKHVDCHYPLISRSNQLPHHFLEGFVDHLNQTLKRTIRLTEFRGDIHLTAEEMTVKSPVEDRFGYQGPYWIVASGGKRDFTIKWWDSRRYQRVIDHFQGQIQFVQIGAAGDFHPELDGVLDLRGRTDLRQLLRLIYRAEGILCPVTSLMHLAAAVPAPMTGTLRPCIVIAGGREPVHWESYPGHQFLHTIGMLSCCATGGCWRARTIPLNDGSHFNDERFLCVDVVKGLPRCMDMITAEDVIRRLELVLSGRRSCLAQAGTDGPPSLITRANILVPDAKADPEALLMRHYSGIRTLPKLPLAEDLSGSALGNTPHGLGDTLILTQLPTVAARQGMVRHIHSDSPHFRPLMRFNPHYIPAENRPRVAADFLVARHDLGNGHFTQRVQRAFGLKPVDRPAGTVHFPAARISRRVALHFEPGLHSLWQRTHVHPRARELYPESKRELQQFIFEHPEWSFIQFGGQPTPLEGAEDATGLPLELTIEKLAECEFFVGIVSGPMHLATALGVQCVVILNFPRAHEIMLPTLKDTGRLESEWLYPQNVHLHQEDDAPLVRRFSRLNLERALQGELYPFWSDRWLPLIHERIPEP